MPNAIGIIALTLGKVSNATFFGLLLASLALNLVFGSTHLGPAAKKISGPYPVGFKRVWVGNNHVLVFYPTTTKATKFRSQNLWG